MIMTKIKTVLIIEDHPAYRTGLKTIIEENGKYRVIGETGTAEEGIRLVCELKPDIAIVDLQLPDKHGIYLTKKLTEQSEKTHVVIITAHSVGAFAHRALKAGAKGYVIKDSDSEVIPNCLDSVMKGEEYIDVSLLLNSDFLSRPNDKYGRLSDREQDVMRLLVEDYSEKKIAKKLGIRLNTVKTHRTGIY
jgi:DNA-binding NarL/FixJ family response regulator